MVVRVATTTEIIPDVPTANLLATTKTGRVDRRSSSGPPRLRPKARASTTTLGTLRPRDRAADGQAEREAGNQVRFAWWGAEEASIGSSSTSIAHARQIKNTAVNLNFDMVGSPNFVRFVYDGERPTPTRSPRPAPASSRPSSSTSPLRLPPSRRPSSRSDYDAFISVGIGAAVHRCGGREDGRGSRDLRRHRRGAYDHCYHQACDTIANLSNGARPDVGRLCAASSRSR